VSVGPRLTYALGTVADLEGFSAPSSAQGSRKQAKLQFKDMRRLTRSSESSMKNFWRGTFPTRNSSSEEHCTRPSLSCVSRT
ncbi:hypothetical protein FA13DRAFT_1740067, partial [Coprinellus micaceus]